MFDKLLAYAKLVPKALANFPNVVEGIINNVHLEAGSLPEDQKEEIIKRRLICAACPFNSNFARVSPEYRDLHNGQSFKIERGRENELYCSICDCNINWKTASLDEKCGLNYYNDLHPDNKQELKWDVYNKNQING